MKEEENEVVGLIGDYDWKYMRASIISELIDCQNEIDFLEVLTALMNSIGTKEEIETRRKELKIKPLSKKDKELMRKNKIK